MQFEYLTYLTSQACRKWTRPRVQQMLSDLLRIALSVTTWTSWNTFQNLFNRKQYSLVSMLKVIAPTSGITWWSKRIIFDRKVRKINGRFMHQYMTLTVLSRFGTCMCFSVEINLSRTCLVSGLVSFEHPSVLPFYFTLEGLEHVMEDYHFYCNLKERQWVQKLHQHTQH